MRMTLFGTIILMTLAATAAFAQAPPRSIAVFPVELWDTGGEGVKPGQAERLERATQTLTRLLEQTGEYHAVDLSSYKDRIEKTEPRYNCNGCWKPIAKEAGANYALLAAVHKVSSLISSVDIYIVDIATDKNVAYASGQFRGDDDQAYTRAMQFLVKDRLIPSETEAPAEK